MTRLSGAGAPYKFSMSKDSQFVDFVLEQMSSLDGVHARAMFGGHGIYQGDLMFALIADGGLYFKTDELTRDEYTARGLRPFTYEARGKSIALQYYAAPPEVFDEPDEMRRWAELAIEAALRGNRDKKRTGKPRRPRQG